MILEHRDGYWLLEGGPVPPGVAGMTIGNLVIVRHGALTERLLRHELVHVQQFRVLGWPRFVARYLAQYTRWRLRGYPHRGAYRRIPQEIEAYWLERLEYSNSPSG